MDYSSDNSDNFETSWVFVENDDIAKEAVVLDPSQKNNEANYSSEESFKNLPKCLTKSSSDSELVRQNDNLQKSLSQLLLDHDTESDGLSIISNWSYSLETPELSLDDGSGVIENYGRQICYDHCSDDVTELQAYEEGQKHDEQKQGYKDEETERYAVEELHNFADEEDIENNMYSDIEGVEKDLDEGSRDNEVENNTDLAETRSFPVLSEERILQYESNLLDQLKWLEEPPGRNEYIENDNDWKTFLSKILEGIKKNVGISGFLIGTVVIAVSSICLGRYFTATETIQDDFPTFQENGFLYDVPNEENFDVEQALSLCREKHKSDYIYMEINAQKCLSRIEKRLKSKKHNKIIKEKFKSWEKYLEKKEKILNKKERKLRKQGEQFQSKDKKYDKNGEPDKVMSYRRQEYDSKEKKIKVREDFKQMNEFISIDNNNLKQKNEEKYRRDSSKEKMHKICHNSGKKCKKLSDIYKNVELHMKPNENDKSFLRIEEKTKNHKHSSDEKLTKQDKGKYSHNFSKGNNVSCQKNKKECRSARNKYKEQNYEPNFVIIGRNNETVDGDWINKLFRGRSDLRIKANSGEWYFDRSSYRKRKRDKAEWYFDWMMDREILRYRRLYLNL